MKKKILNTIKNGLYELINFVYKAFIYVLATIMLTVFALYVVICIATAALFAIIIAAPLYAIRNVIKYGDSFTDEYVDYLTDVFDTFVDVISDFYKSQIETES
jgi:hypothetical protein